MRIQYEDFNPIDVDNDLLKLFVPYYLTGPTINFEPSRENTNALRMIMDVDEPNFLRAISSNEEPSLSIYCVVRYSKKGPCAKEPLNSTLACTHINMIINTCVPGDF
ncbi:hypothetical protein HZH68_011409 [Vespula germanica]|uniref:Uncharacterized protein n=1 Tax=Vespula germanica TaxID=30212 RepID=A0A834JNP0_VESGE|nr:hypothetical protein HZH68_011409 [Vespula germanica]